MSSWRFLIIHTCRAEVASDHMGWQTRGQLPHLLKRAQREPTSEVGGALSLRKGQFRACEHMSVYFYMCVCVRPRVCTVEQKGK